MRTPDERPALRWWEVKDSAGNRLRQSPELDRLDEEMAQKAAVPDDGQGARE